MSSSLSGESFWMNKSKAIPLPIPTVWSPVNVVFVTSVHIPTPLIIPKSPSYKSMLFSSLTYVGGAIRTCGGAAEV